MRSKQLIADLAETVELQVTIICGAGEVLKGQGTPLRLVSELEIRKRLRLEASHPLLRHDALCAREATPNSLAWKSEGQTRIANRTWWILATSLPSQSIIGQSKCQSLSIIES